MQPNALLCLGSRFVLRNHTRVQVIRSYRHGVGPAGSGCGSAPGADGGASAAVEVGGSDAACFCHTMLSHVSRKDQGHRIPGFVRRVLEFPIARNYGFSFAFHGTFWTVLEYLRAADLCLFCARQ